MELEQKYATIATLEAKIRDDEMLRRKLHNTIQELKGNIRVFCRIRPMLEDPPETGLQFAFPDSRSMEIITAEAISSTLASFNSEKQGSNAAAMKTMTFSYDKVFPPHSTQDEVFEELSQLVQSALDGYRACIFTYGQTGSGKTFTMEGFGPDHPDPRTRGMIPRAVEQIFRSAEALAEKGWRYEYEAFFLEIYNEEIRDLLRPAHSKNQEEKQYKIKHEPGGNTVVTDLTVVKVERPTQVYELLKRANHQRSVAATLKNQHSSRSHR
jgi:kinesin family protein C1